MHKDKVFTARQLLILNLLVIIINVVSEAIAFMNFPCDVVCLVF